VQSPDEILADTLVRSVEASKYFANEVALHMMMLLQEEGFVIVPIKPCGGMVKAGQDEAISACNYGPPSDPVSIYNAMLNENPYRLGSDEYWAELKTRL
jgi:hypothetical protein